MDKSHLNIPMSHLGAPTSPLVAKQLEEFGKSLNQGVKNIEIGTISADKFEFIPQQHFDEIKRLAKLTDAKVSVHAPLIDLAGFPTAEGQNRWREEQRKTAEEQVFSILERAHKLSNGENVPVVFHAGHMRSQEYEKGLMKIKTNEDGNPEYEEKIIDGKMVTVEKLEPSDIRSITAVNLDTGEIVPVDYEEKYHIAHLGPGKEGKVVWDPFTKLRSQNATRWDEEKLGLLTFQKEIEDLRVKLNLKLKQNEAMKKTGLIEDPNYKNTYEMNLLDINRMENHIREINRKLSSSYQETYNKFIHYASDNQKEEYGKIHEHLKNKYVEGGEKIENIYRDIHKIDSEVNSYMKKAEEEQNESAKLKAEQLLRNREEKLKELLDTQITQSNIVVTDISQMKPPQIWKPVGEFAIEKTAETVSGAIAKMYAKLRKDGKEKETPFIALENFFVNAPMSRASDLRQAVELGRKKLAEKLKEYNIPEGEAKTAAENLIAATWDVGHINNLRKGGWEGEELKKKVIEETKEIADLVRHVHITDNFGFHDSHLPPGMGNVPIKEIMEELEKKWAVLEEEGKLKHHPRSIVEAGGFVGEIGANPTLNILEFFGSPLYKLGPGPYWGGEAIATEQRVGFSYTPYREAFVEFPQQHFNMYGSSFTTLPKSVGGQVGGETSRFSGAPNQ